MHAMLLLYNTTPLFSSITAELFRVAGPICSVALEIQLMHCRITFGGFSAAAGSEIWQSRVAYRCTVD